MADSRHWVDKSNATTVVTMARQAISAGNLSLAEALCQEALVYNAAFAPALTVLAQIYRGLGLWPQAISAAQRAIAANADDPALAAILDTPLEPPRSPSPGPRFLIIKSWGHGLLSDVGHVLGACLLAEITDRIPVTDWGTNSRYGDGSGADAFRFFFEPVSPPVAADVARDSKGPVFPWYWTLANLETSPPMGAGGPRRPRALQLLDRPEPVAVCEVYVTVAELLPHLPDTHPMFGQPMDAIYRYLVRRYLKVRDNIEAEAQAFFDANLSGSRTVAVHLRGSDKRGEYDIDALNAELLDAVAALGDDWRVFVLSDDDRLVRQCLARFGARAILTACQRTEMDVGLHLQGGDGVRLGREVVLDCSIALRCDAFFGGGTSNVAALIEVMKDWPSGACRLLGASVLHDRGLGLFKLR